jgi:hypothetical protein
MSSETQKKQNDKQPDHSFPPVPEDEQLNPAERFPTDNQRPMENPPSEGLKHVQENTQHKR